MRTAVCAVIPEGMTKPQPSSLALKFQAGVQAALAMKLKIGLRQKRFWQYLIFQNKMSHFSRSDEGNKHQINVSPSSLGSQRCLSCLG